MLDILAASTESSAITSIWSGAALIALITLTVLEIVLGIDNIIFISVLADKLPKHQQAKARTLGLTLAMIMRIVMLLGIGWIMGLTTPVPGVGSWLGFITPDNGSMTWRDFILLGGGLFLIYKSVTEIHEKLEGKEHAREVTVGLSFTSVIIQILILDIVFSLDSVITAIGMVQNPSGDRTAQLIVMVTAVVIAVAVMLFAAGPISRFVNRHPTVKMLAFSFLILVGVVLIVDATHRHIPKGYIYFAMAFSIVVEMLNLRLRSRGETVRLHTPQLPES
ncbi:MAG: membrane protein [Phycisphaerae bacterium]|nr:MAG: membrane protein [Phycisphaerae bacterium]